MRLKEDITTSQEFNIRYTVPEDEPFLKQWLVSPGMTHWFSVEDEAEVEEMVKIWISFARFKCSLTATYHGQVCGIATLFLMPYVKLIHFSMGYLIVDPSFQRKGVGSALVKNLDHLAKTYFHLERMQYEVFGENPLITLLMKQGYNQLFVQEKYVKEEGGEYLGRTVLEKVFKK